MLGSQQRKESSALPDLMGLSGAQVSSQRAIAPPAQHPLGKQQEAMLAPPCWWRWRQQWQTGSQRRPRRDSERTAPRSRHTAGGCSKGCALEVVFPCRRLRSRSDTECADPFWMWREHRCRRHRRRRHAIPRVPVGTRHGRKKGKNKWLLARASQLLVCRSRMHSGFTLAGEESAS